MKTPTRQAGFTLLEVMIAMAILAAMALALFVATQQTLDSKSNTEGRDDANHAVTQAMDRMAYDLEMAVMIKSKDLLGATFDGEYAFEGQEQRLDFVTMSHSRFLADSKESELAEVSYYLAPMPDDANLRILMRRQSTAVDKNLQQGGIAYPILEYVDNIRFEYLDSKNDEYKKTWDSKSMDFNNRLPMAVKITIETQLPDDEQKSTFTTLAPIQLKEPLNF
ncbi:MAG TPA: type II secretion system protein GspJ [bacterium]|nr:type II secretion system protein GspJ [bacterium]